MNSKIVTRPRCRVLLVSLFLAGERQSFVCAWWHTGLRRCNDLSTVWLEKWMHAVYAENRRGTVGEHGHFTYDLPVSVHWLVSLLRLERPLFTSGR